MPDDSAYIAEVQGGPQFRGWSIDRYLLANLQDLLQGANYQRGGGKGRKPKPAYRPKKKSAGVSIAGRVPRRVKGVSRG